MYILAKSFYTQVSWGQRMFFKGISFFIDPETKEKISLHGMQDPEELK
jgi:hypothetical protein